ncbi:MAG TPA: hypothetical protein VGU69_10655 [Rhizomicrobium sp.]|nr:hypothetical protein [Rhizomicrobium sp.]
MFTITTMTSESDRISKRNSARKALKDAADKGFKRVGSNIRLDLLAYIDRIKEQEGFGNRDAALNLLIDQHKASRESKA